jgi:hypothetical protein
MNIAKAINRLVWRMSNQKFTPNENDKEAVNFLVDWISKEKQETKDKNTLFNKMFVYALYREMQYWKEVHQSQRVLQEQLEKPLEWHYNRFHELLNTLELESFKKEIGYCNLHPQLRTEEQEKTNIELLKTHKEKFTSLQENKYISEDEVFMSLNNLLTEVINKYKNLP